MTEDLEEQLAAISSVASALQQFDGPGQIRVVEIALKMLGNDESFTPNDAKEKDEEKSKHDPPPPLPTDVRTLKDEKSPKNGIEMAVLAAYYLRELAPDGERKDTLNVTAMRAIFIQAGFPLPEVPKNTLANAKNAGYLDAVSRGEYALNPVGHNLAAHGLPQEGSRSTPRRTRKRRTTKTRGGKAAKKQPAKKRSTKKAAKASKRTSKN